MQPRKGRHGAREGRAKLRLFKIVTAALLAFAPGSATVAQSPASLAPPIAQPDTVRAAPAPVAPRVASGGVPMTRADLEAWLDGYMPFALARGNIAGAVVVVVKDGQVLLQKGYGFSDVARRRRVDPETTLFRPGSVSKLFTWTAVMQLVEADKLDLDRDVNAYLDFKIPLRDGKPITLRNIMTHTAGFEESARYTITAEPQALGPLMKKSLPARLFAPGTTPAYSNYATALAGYIVERVSGLPFDDYIDTRVLQPIGMNRSTFRQPLPVALKPLMSNGYALASGDAKPFEHVGPAPAGSLSATGADMAKFMIAHLENGRGLLRPETAAAMHNTKLDILPPLNRMALGFYEENINGRRVIGHGGDTQFFHSNMSLFLDENVGLFVSVNSAGANGATGPLRSALFEQFADRYFPAPRAETRVDAETAKQHAQMMAGSYANSRGFKTVFLSIAGLFGQSNLGVDDKGGLIAADVTGLANQPRKWVEIAPFVWRDVGSGERLAAKVVDGEVTRWSFDTVSPFMMFDRVPWYLNSSWLVPAFLAGLAVVFLTALAWPAGAIARRRYKGSAPFTGRRLKVSRLTHVFAWAAVLIFAVWAFFITSIFSDLSLLSGALDWVLYTLQFLTPIALFGLLVLAAYNLWLVWTEKRGWFAKLWSVLFVFGAAMLLWVALGFHLIGFGTNY